MGIKGIYGESKYRKLWEISIVLAKSGVFRCWCVSVFMYEANCRKSEFCSRLKLKLTHLIEQFREIS
jgi:hypothetical protein